MTGLFIFLQIVVCILLVVVILMQAGRGGGLTEQFSSAETMFGTKTNSFMVRLTSVFAIVFFVSSLSLAWLSSRQDKSLMSQVPIKATTTTPSVDSTSNQKATGQTLIEKKESAVESTLPSNTTVNKIENQLKEVVDSTVNRVEQKASKAIQQLPELKTLKPTVPLEEQPTDSAK